MFLLSFLIHLAVFSLVFLAPESAPTRSLKGVIYEVNLVELPKAGKVGRHVGKKPVSSRKSRKGIVLRRKRKSVRRLGRIKAKEKPIVIAKKRIKVRRKRVKKIDKISEKTLEKALAKLEKKVKTQERQERETSQVEKAISKIERQVKEQASQRSGEGAGGVPTGIALRVYKMEVEERIKSNWAYPVGITDEEKRKGLEAIVILTVKRDGTISEYHFKKKSNDPFFDESVTKAIEKSNPLPPFPEGYVKSSEEIEINFNLSEFESA